MWIRISSLRKPSRKVRKNDSVTINKISPKEPCEKFFSTNFLLHVQRVEAEKKRAWSLNTIVFQNGIFTKAKFAGNGLICFYSAPRYIVGGKSTILRIETTRNVSHYYLDRNIRDFWDGPFFLSNYWNGQQVLNFLEYHL